MDRSVCDRIRNDPRNFLKNHAHFAVNGGVKVRRAATRHYGLARDAGALAEQAGTCWHALDTAVDNWALVSWSQRFSFAIGRAGARGWLYGPLIPPVLRPIHDPWYTRAIARSDEPQRAEQFHQLQQADRAAFLDVAKRFAEFADALESAGCVEGASLARHEADQIELIAELITSISRFVLAVHKMRAGQWDRLREIVESEIEARQRQLDTTGRLRRGAGVNPLLVAEDIHNMYVFVSSDLYPHVPDDWFSLTPVPYTV